MIGCQSELESNESDQIYYTLLCRVLLGFAVLVPAPEANCAKMQGQNHFAERKGHVLTYNFFFVEFESAGS
jgi:hypothetical protein